jgi:peptide/nickel transport system substrate-binding protein
MSLTACTRSAPPGAEAHTLRIGIQNSPEALPVLTDLLFADPLVTIDWHGRPSLRLASEYQWQDEGRTLQLAIRRGVRFHDGSPVTAAGVADVLRRKERSGGFQFVTAIDTPAEGLVAIHLSHPDAFLLDALSGIPIAPVDKPDVGTGPFKLLTRAPVIRAQRNVEYYRGVPGIEQIQVTTYDTPRTAWAAMMRQEVDMLPELNRDSVEFFEGAARYATYSSIRPFYIPLVFNLRHPILKNIEVRRALAEAVDREEIVHRAMRGHGQVADDPVWPYNWAYTPTARRHNFNPAAAALRLDAAGFPVRRDARPGTMPRRFQIHCLFWDKGPQYERIALMLQRQLAAIDIDLVLERADDKTLQQRLSAGSFDTYLYQLASGKSFDWTYRFWHSPLRGGLAIQDSGYGAADESLDRLRQARSDGDIRVALSDVRARFFEDVPAVFIAWVEATRAVDSRFDVGDASDPEILANLWRWTVAKPEQRAQR